METVHFKPRGKRYPETVVVLASASKYRAEAKVFIENLGYQVLATEDVFEAIAWAQMEYGLHPIILVTEYNLKGGDKLSLYDGLQLIKHLSGRKMFPLVSIFVHDKHDDAMFAEAMKFGAFQCFSKRVHGGVRYNLGEQFKQAFASAELLLKLKMKAILDPRASDMDNDVLVYNEDGAKQRWEHTWREARAEKGGKLPSCINFDLVGFGRANEECHEDGNRLIREIAELVCSHIRPTDYVYRDCGDKFLLFLPRTNHDEAKKISARLKLILEGIEFKLSSQKPVTFSFRDAVITCEREELGMNAEYVYARITDEADKMERKKKKQPE